MNYTTEELNKAVEILTATMEHIQKDIDRLPLGSKERYQKIQELHRTEDIYHAALEHIEENEKIEEIDLDTLEIEEEPRDYLDYEDQEEEIER